MEEYKLKLKLNPYEKSLLDELTTRGWSETEVLRIALRTLHKKEFPNYLLAKVPIKAKKKSDVMTEESCLEGGGEIIIDSGQRYCEVRHGGMTVKKLLQ